MTEQDIKVGNDYKLTCTYTKQFGEKLVISQNIRSVNTNGNKFKDLINELKADIIGIQETWNKDLKIDGYKTLSVNRPNRGGCINIVA